MIARSLLSAWLLIQTAIVHASLPMATGESSRPECVDAMKLAKAMYKSTARRVYAPLRVPEGMKSKLILGASDLDISGGSALQGSDDFERLPQGNRGVYWARKADGKHRVVIDEMMFNWRGDMYDLYLLDEAVQQADFMRNKDNPRAESHYQAVVAKAWRPPLVFQLKEDDAKWFIDVGQPWQILQDWRVYGAGEGRVVCVISFHPPSKGATELLPEQVVALARMLDEALGPGNNEGTLHPTVGIRLNTQHVLANAALRPWALSDSDAYNSRNEVDAGLQEWAGANRSRRRLQKEITTAYPSAEHALTTYYKSAYHLPSRQAEKMAAWAMDLIFRSYFVFPKNGDYIPEEGVRTNPWPPTH